MIDLSSKKLLGAVLDPIIDAALVARQQDEQPRNYMGGSRLGVECDRALQYEFFHAPKDPGKEFSGRILRVFERGHWVEAAMVNWLRLAGVEIRTGNPDGTQFGYSRHDGLERGHCDGVIVGGPAEFGPFPRLWENKGLQEKDWKEIVNRGLHYSKPVYYAQCQIYMDRFNLTANPALFIAVNMNTMEIHWEPVPFNPGAVQQLDAKAARILNACRMGELLPRLSQDPAFYLCKWCSWGQRCHAK